MVDTGASRNFISNCRSIDMYVHVILISTHHSSHRQIKIEQRDHYTKEVEALSRGEGDYEVIFHIDFHQLSFEKCSFIQEMVLGVYY